MTEIKRKLERLAAEADLPEEELLRRVLAGIRLERTLADVGLRIAERFKQLGIITIDDAEAYLGETAGRL